MLSVVELTEAELDELEWWCKHHKGNVIYLINCINNLLAGEPHSRQILDGALLGYGKMYLTKDPEGNESESEAKTTN